jgi:hypothetical protein
MAVMLPPDTVTENVAVGAFDGLRVNTPAAVALSTVPVLFFDPTVNS